ncbi:MAG: cell division protein FtsQ/DivIB [Mesorhizobium sp.]
MSAVRWGRHGGRGARVSSPYPSFGRFVLPRWLRRPARMVAHFGRGDFVPPRFAATLVSAALLGSSGAYGAYLGGHMDSIVQGFTARTGFAVDQIKVVGNRETSEIDILGSLELDGWTSLIGFDVDAARDRVAALPWVESATVRKIYPHTLEVRVEERQAFALWQSGDKLSVIERSGHVIAPYSGGKQALLPLFVSADVPLGAPDLLARMDKFPDLASRVKGYVSIGGRRWDVKMLNGVTVKLPEAGVDKAIASLAGFEDKDGILERDIVAVDMRFADRLVVQLSPEANSARQAALLDASKAAQRKKETKI